ncbi:phage capsid [Trichococcus flocculiformis]|uniref:Phage capsid n=2 Tax=Trichococcus flocculiformis TaxID=82803 RepID=A0AB38BI06_9LACT|nr:phage major capsid protein [Trichococcus flocculiformis]CZQ88279.1 phage capsid [Trichococcus flocculiformis]SFH80427.1 phage major capsid protein, HK97 family [Trichococcus flocculiformis]
MSTNDIQRNRMRNKLINMRYGDAEPMNEYNKRNQIHNLLRIEEVRNFYSDLQVRLRNGSLSRAAEIVIPEEAEDSLTELIKEYSALYSEVRMIPIGIDGRAVVSVDDVKAVWSFSADVLTEMDSSLAAVELEDNKLGCFTSVPNSTLENTLIDMALYIEDLLAQAMAYGFDDAVINGVGNNTSVFEPRGIMMNLPIANQVTLAMDAMDQSSVSPGHILNEISLITPGTKDDIGEVIAVMKRKTYYNYAAAGANSSLPYPNLNGVRVKFTPAVGDKKIILGDFKQYVMGKRRGVKIASSDQVKFTDDQTLFKVSGRFDGQPLNNAAFVEITDTTI